MVAYTNFPINLVGGESKSRSRFWSSQSSVNLYIDVQGSGRTESALLSWPGEKAWSSGSSATNRGIYVTSEGAVYSVNDTSLYSVSSGGVQTALGSIFGSGRCIFADDGENVLIATAGSSVTYINNQFVFNGAGQLYKYDGANVTQISTPSLNSKQWCSSNAGTTTFQSVNIASAEALGDDLIQVVAFDQKLYLFGSKSIEVFYNTGTGSPPFARIEQSVNTDIGIVNSGAAAYTPDYLYFLSPEGVVYRVSAFQPESITPPNIAREILSGQTSDAFGFTCKLDGASFYILQLPTAGLTLAFSERSQEWTRLSTGSSLGRHLSNGYAYAFNKHLISDYNSSDIYEWDFDTYNSNGSTIIRQRDSSPINGVSLGVPGRRLVMNRASFLMETGVGNTSIPDPKVMISASYDGGRSFTGEDWISLGREGDPVKMIHWNNMATFYDLVLRVKVSDPAFVAIHGGSVSLKRAGL